jgi:hypothetical protein
MRFVPAFFPAVLAALVLFPAPLLAQEPAGEPAQGSSQDRSQEERAKEKAREEAAKRDAEAVRAKAEDLRRLIEDLRSKSDATRADAMAALKRANASLDELLPLVADALRQAEEARTKLGTELQLAMPTRTLLLGAAGSETISGSADGTDYTLRSLGDGKYELTATKHSPNGQFMEKTVDKGTLKELQDKYSFLGSALALQVSYRSSFASAALRALASPSTVATPGVYDGGGVVGVTVTPPSDELRFHLELPEGAGFIVQEVAPGSRAEQIGIRRMDVLLRIDGELIDSPIQLKKLHESQGILEIIRRAESKKIDLSTFPAEKPAPIPPEKVTEEAAPRPPAGAR